MAETTARNYGISKETRPSKRVSIKSETTPERGFRFGAVPPSGIEVTISRDGLNVFGWYDSMVGIEGYTIPWDEFDELREWATRA